jgi:general stress protein YciG
MPGTVTGGKQAAETNKRKYGKDFYARIGAAGGRKGTTGGFAANRELARIAGAKGGRISRRRKADATVAATTAATTPAPVTQNDVELAA